MSDRVECAIDVKGNSGKTYTFNVWVESRYLAEWQADGIHIDQIVQIVPVIGASSTNIEFPGKNWIQ